MKKLIAPTLAAVALAALSACSHTTVNNPKPDSDTVSAPPPSSTTTTTQQTTTQPPPVTTTTSQTTQSN